MDYNMIKSMADARNVINQAKKYSQMSYLCNCTYLVNDLKLFPRKIGNSHAQMLIDKINKLSNSYKYQSRDSYFDKLSNLEKQVKEYKTNATVVYGYKWDTDNMESQLRKYRDNANRYYEY